MTVKELTAAPNLVPLFGKAAVGVLPVGHRSGGDLPDTTYVRSGITVDPDHLAHYDRVCGFRLSDELPATYPHLLAFPLQVKLMTDPGFPFPMIGLVHLSNRISQHRPLRIGEPLTVRVRAENSRPHDRGTQFDMRSEALVDGEVVWTDISTYLRRGGGSGGEKGPRRSREAPEGPVSARWRVPGDTGRRYAEVSGDHNPIHLYPLTARLLGFNRAIAHGMWAKARCLAFFEGRLSAAFTVDVSFKLPVLLPATVALRSRTDSAGGFGFTLADDRTGKPHLTGTITPG